MQKYQKFVFQDLSKSLVVNLSETEDIDYHQEEMINNVITEHLNNITKEEEQIETEEEQEKALIIERMKSLSYNQGAEDTRIHYESIVSKLQLENDFSSILYSKIEDINPVVKIDTQIAKLYAEIISSIAKKIYLILPVDFELMLEQELLSRLQKFYKEGQIKLIINPSKYDLCRKVLAIENLPLKYSENFHIIQDDKLGDDDCKLEWCDTSLEYSQEQINVEIDTILEQLKNKINLLKRIK